MESIRTGSTPTIEGKSASRSQTESGGRPEHPAARNGRRGVAGLSDRNPSAGVRAGRGAEAAGVAGGPGACLLSPGKDGRSARDIREVERPFFRTGRRFLRRPGGGGIARLPDGRVAVHLHLGGVSGSGKARLQPGFGAISGGTVPRGARYASARTCRGSRVE